MKLPKQKTANKREISYILYANIIAFFLFKTETFTHVYIYKRPLTSSDTSGISLYSSPC